jgi:glycosyltransferase involved in cell wall biosynthesis
VAGGSRENPLSRPCLVAPSIPKNVIYICIPAHDEGPTIGVLLWKVRNTLGEFSRDYRILVYDDASTDDTPVVLERYRRVLPLTVLGSREQIGYGRSVEKLLRHVVETASYPKRDCAVVLQGDFTEHPDDIVGLVKILEGGADIVAGVADMKGRRVPFGVKIVRNLSRWPLSTVFRGAPVSDPLSGLRAYRVIVLKKALRDGFGDRPLVRAEGWAANVELLSRLVPHARRIAEIPLEVRHDLRQRGSRFRPISTLMALMKLRGSELWPTSNPQGV